MTIARYSYASYADEGTDSGDDEQIMQADAPSLRARGGHRRGTKHYRRLHFPVDQLQHYYHLPLKTAAQELGICEAALKRICRRNHIKKWPYRQLQSVLRRIEEESRLRAMQLAFRDEFITTEASSSTDFLLPHEIENRRKTSVALLAQLSREQRVRAQRIERLKKEKQAIIDSAHTDNPFPPMPRYVPTDAVDEDEDDDEFFESSSSVMMLDVIQVDDPLDMLASLNGETNSDKNPKRLQDCRKSCIALCEDGDIRSVEILSCMMTMAADEA